MPVAVIVYDGTCRGGPHDGKRATSEKKEWYVMIAFADKIPRLLGTYGYVLGQWIWRDNDDT